MGTPRGSSRGSPGLPPGIPQAITQAHLPLGFARGSPRGSKWLTGRIGRVSEGEVRKVRTYYIETPCAHRVPDSPQNGRWRVGDGVPPHARVTKAVADDTVQPILRSE